MPSKIFTREEANQLLSELQKILEDLRRFQARARKKYEEMRDIREVGYRKDGNLIMLTDYQLAKREFDEIVADANRILAEANERGCRVTDVELGLVDFPALLNGEEVFLCWQVGEPEVQYYHTRREGYRGRKPWPRDEEASS